MRLVVNRAKLADAVKSATLVTKPTSTILNQVLVQFDGDETLLLTTTDTNVGFRTRMSIDSQKDGSKIDLCVNASLFCGLLHECTGDVVALDAEDNKLVLRDGKDSFTIICGDPSTFPAMPEFSTGPALMAKAQDLHRVLDRVRYAASRNSQRYALNSVCLESKDGKLLAVATDGLRVAHDQCDCAPSIQDWPGDPVLCDVNLANAVCSLLEPAQKSSEDRLVTISLCKRLVSFSVGNDTLWAAQIEGRYPDWRRFFGMEPECEVKMKRADLLLALGKARYFSDDRDPSAHISFDDGDDGAVHCEASDRGTCRVRVNMKSDGKTLDKEFRVRFLVDALKCVDSEEITVRNHKKHAVVCVEAGETFKYAVMPMTQE